MCRPIILVIYLNVVVVFMQERILPPDIKNIFNLKHDYLHFIISIKNMMIDDLN